MCRLGRLKLTKGKLGCCGPEHPIPATIGDPSVALQLALDGTGITILPLWMASDPAVAKRLFPVLAMGGRYRFWVCPFTLFHRV